MNQNIADIMQVRKEKQEKFLAALLEGERSAIPFPDEPPIAYAPDSFYKTKIFRNWGELSAHRKKRWGSATFSELPSKETERLENLLQQPTDKVKAENYEKIRLDDALDNLRRSFNINFRIDLAAFKEEGGPDNFGEAELPERLPPWRGIALGTILRDMLARM
jgi:hypothetical protein